MLTGCCYYFFYFLYAIEGTGLLLIINSIFLILFFIFSNKIKIVYLRLPLYLLVGVTFFYTYILDTVNKTVSGEKGVLFKKFEGGLDKETIYGQGFHVIAPWDHVKIYETCDIADVKIYETSDKMEVLSKNGCLIKIDLSFRYMPVEDKIGNLHDFRDYLERIIKPEIRSITCEVIGNYLPEELYSTKREVIQDEIEALTRVKIEAKYLTVDAILIKKVTLP